MPRPYVFSLLLLGSTALFAQQTPTPQPPPTPATTQTDINSPTASTEQGILSARADGYAARAVLPQEKRPIVALSFGVSYLHLDLTNTGDAHSGDLLGWYAIPQLNFTHHWGVIADFNNLYDWPSDRGENIHGITGGPVYMLPLARATPFVFVEGGEVRDSYQGSVTWTPAGVGGLGVNVKLTPLLAFQLVPAEWVENRNASSNWQGNYNAKAGLVLTWER